MFKQCNFCKLEALKASHGADNLIRVDEDGWPTFYIEGEPAPGQDRQTVDGKPVKFLVSFMALTTSCVC